MGRIACKDWGFAFRSHEKRGHTAGPILLRRHTIVGAELLARIPFFAQVHPLVRSCHEHWDGGGYPDGLRESLIPRGARIILACDALSAMTTDRPYRRRRARAEALRELQRGSGSQFDPAVIDAVVAESDLLVARQTAGLLPTLDSIPEKPST